LPLAAGLLHNLTGGVALALGLGLLLFCGFSHRSRGRRRGVGLVLVAQTGVCESESFCASKTGDKHKAGLCECETRFRSWLHVRRSRLLSGKILKWGFWGCRRRPSSCPSAELSMSDERRLALFVQETCVNRYMDQVQNLNPTGGSDSYIQDHYITP
jgi:hypothetical protein